MIADPKKIVVIYNTDDTSGNSSAIADYYISARGLDPALKKGYALGTVNLVPYATASSASFLSLLTQIGTDLDAALAQGVVLSINCPTRVQISTTFGNYQDNASLCRVIADAKRVGAAAGTFPKMSIGRAPARLTNPNDWSFTNGVEDMYVTYPAQTARTFAVTNPTTPRQMDWRATGSVDADGSTRPCGRIGKPDTLAHDVDLAKRIIDDAVWFEQHGNPRSESVMFGYSYRAANFMHHGQLQMAYNYLRPRIGHAHVYDGAINGQGGFSTRTWDFTMPKVTVKDQVKWLTGGGPKLRLWGWLGTGLMNPVDITAHLASVDFARGGWMFESTSKPISVPALDAGACAVIYPTGEPFAEGLPVIGSLGMLLAHGYSIMEAVDIALYPNIATSAYEYRIECGGDPLYTPFVRVSGALVSGLSGVGQV